MCGISLNRWSPGWGTAEQLSKRHQQTNKQTKSKEKSFHFTELLIFLLVRRCSHVTYSNWTRTRTCTKLWALSLESKPTRHFTKRYECQQKTVQFLQLPFALTLCVSLYMLNVSFFTFQLGVFFALRNRWMRWSAPWFLNQDWFCHTVACTWCAVAARETLGPNVSLDERFIESSD